MQITIAGEGTRRALTFAVWQQAHDTFGDGTSAFYDEMPSAARRHDWKQELLQANEAVESLRATLRDADRIRDAVCGDTVELESSSDVLQSGVVSCADYVRENEEFWDSDPHDHYLRLRTDTRTKESNEMTDEDIKRRVQEYAPEMDPQDVIEFMAEHPKPNDESDSHVAWATKLLRERGEGQFGDGPPIEKVTRAMRQHDARQE